MWVAVCKDKGETVGGEIMSAYCSCTAGLLGCCNHVIAMLFRVQEAVMHGFNKPSCTSELAVWPIPKNTKEILTVKPVAEVVFMKKHFRKCNHEDKSTEDKKKNLDFKPYYEKQGASLSNQAKMRETLFEALKDAVPRSRFVENMTSTKSNQQIKSVLPKNIITKAKEFPYDINVSTNENIRVFTQSLQLSADEIKIIFEKTVE